MFLVQPKPEDEPRYKRWSQVHATVRKLLEQGAELVIPTPSLAEMYAGGEDGERVAVELEKLGTVLSFEDFDDEAARIAGRLTRTWLVTRKQLQPAPSRQLVKFDAMIVATAVAAGADCIVTTDIDIEKWVNTLDEADRIEVIDAAAPKGQLALIQ